jgi:hypothetical protein
MLRRGSLLALLILGVFWLGRESAHGVHALYEHWWCPLPIVFIVVAVVAWPWRQHGRTAA